MAVRLDLLIELNAQGAIAGVKQLNSEVDKLGGAAGKANGPADSLFKTIFGGVTAANMAVKAFDQLTKFVTDSIGAYMESEKINVKLNSALRANGESVKVTGENIEEFASKMQFLTGVDDEQVKSLEALARSYGIHNDLVDSAVEGTIGLVQLYGGDYESTLKAVSKAYEGEWGMITKIIPELGTMSSESDKLSLLQKKMADGIQAAAEGMQSQLGQIQQLKSEWDNFKEAFGGVVVSFLTGMANMNGALSARQYMQKIVMEQMAAEKKQQDTLLFGSTLQRKETEARLILEDRAAKSEATWAAEMDQYIKDGFRTKKQIADDEAKIVKDHVAALNAEDDAQKKAAKAQKEMNKWVADFNSLMPSANVGFGAYIRKLQEEYQAQAAVNSMMGPGVDFLDDFTDSIQLDLAGIKDHSSGLSKWMDQWAESTSTLDKVSEGLYMVDNALADMGVTLGPQAQAFRDAADGGMQLVDGLINGDPLEVIGGAIKVVTSLFKAFAGDGIGEAIKREKVLLGVNAELIKQIKDLAKQLGDTHEATSIMLDQVIAEADITIQTFDTYAQRVREILSDYDRNQMTIGQTAKEIGDSFSALITKAQELGTEGSKSLITLFDDLASRGIQVAEIQKYIQEQLQSGLEGYKAYLTGEFSTATIGVYESLLAYEKKVEENQSLVNGVKGISDALIGLSNTTQLTEEEFDQFEKAAADAFKSLTDHGFTARESLTQMAPMLARLKFLHDQYGLSIDVSTQALFDQAEAQGVNLNNYKTQEEIFGEMNASLKDLVDIFKNVFPPAIDKTNQAWKELNKTAKNMPDLPSATGTGPGTKIIPGKTAAIGFYSSSLPSDTLIQAHQGEAVMIYPKNDIPSVWGRTDKSGIGGGSNNGGINIQASFDINVSPKSGIDAQDLVAGLKIAINDNLRGIADEIYEVVSRRMN